MWEAESGGAEKYVIVRTLDSTCGVPLAIGSLPPTGRYYNMDLLLANVRIGIRRQLPIVAVRTGKCMPDAWPRICTFDLRAFVRPR